MCTRRSLVTLLYLVTLIWGATSVAAQSPALPGDYQGKLGPLRLLLHLKAADGSLSGTLDSVDQGSNGIVCADFRLQGDQLSFTVPSVHGSWQGTVSTDGATLTGTWSQGTPMPLTFERDSFVPAEKPSRIDGAWLGTLKPGADDALRVQYIFRSDRDGKEYCTTDSPDQFAWGIECGEVHWSAPQLSFEVPSIKGTFSGKLSDDGHELVGVWTQRDALPLTLTRQAKALSQPPPAKVTYSPAIAPVDPGQMEAVLAQDFAGALKSGPLSQQGIGVAIGVVRNGVARVFTFGDAKVDSIFEIGSITKTFTGLILGQMITEGRVKLDEPVRDLLPPGTVAKPDGPEITLLDLVTQHSGLPRLPDNMVPADPRNPYADYTPLKLYQFLAKHGVGRPANASFLYSNLAVGLLGQALANRAGTTYPQLLAEQVTVPLHLENTVVSLSAAQRARFIRGHAPSGHPAGAWDLDALAGAGAVRSTATDMLRYLEAQLHPETLSKQAEGTTHTLGAAITMSHDLRAEAGPDMRIAFAWLYQEKRGEYWHNGGTGGYSAYAFFNPKGNYAGVILVNRAPGPDGLPDFLGQHVSQRLAGEPAIVLGD
jgi:serine-type D-Ala-D-Ala carboxypeptidase/endopeptidase